MLATLATFLRPIVEERSLYIYFIFVFTLILVSTVDMVNV